jgi:hypothetical protein
MMVSFAAQTQSNASKTLLQKYLEVGYSGPWAVSCDLIIWILMSKATAWLLGIQHIDID